MAGDDWARYWRADGVPVEAMHAHFTSHVYHRHSHESYSFGVTETGAQAFTCRHGRHVSASGMVMARAANTGWRAAALTIAAAAITLATRLNPMWMLLVGGALGGLGLL